MNSKQKVTVSVVTVILVVLAIHVGFVSWAWQNRQTLQTRKDARREVSKTLRNCKPEEVLPYLERLVSEKSFQCWFISCGNQDPSPWCFWTLRMDNLPKVPYEYIAQLVEEQFIRFAGDGASKLPDVARLKEMLQFSDKFLKMGLLDKNQANSLMERRLDGFFLSGDFDGAIECLETQGVPGRSPAWCKGTAAKLRAHKAMEAKDYAEAIKQLLVFGEFMQSDEQKDFQDCDPTTGIVYSREWVVARNFMRCSKFSKELGNTAKAEEYRFEAMKYFKIALEKAQEDKKSLEVLQKEMHDDNL